MKNLTGNLEPLSKFQNRVAFGLFQRLYTGSVKFF